jgi:hypothetical protein
MKKNRNEKAIKLIERFDQQLHDLLMSDLRAIRSTNEKMYKQLCFKTHQENLMIA